MSTIQTQLGSPDRYHDPSAPLALLRHPRHLGEQTDGYVVYNIYRPHPSYNLRRRFEGPVLHFHIPVPDDSLEALRDVVA